MSLRILYIDGPARARSVALTAASYALLGSEVAVVAPTAAVAAHARDVVASMARGAAAKVNVYVGAVPAGVLALSANNTSPPAVTEPPMAPKSNEPEERAAHVTTALADPARELHDADAADTNERAVAAPPEEMGPPEPTTTAPSDVAQGDPASLDDSPPAPTLGEQHVSDGFVPLSTDPARELPEADVDIAEPFAVPQESDGLGSPLMVASAPAEPATAPACAVVQPVTEPEPSLSARSASTASAADLGASTEDAELPSEASPTLATVDPLTKDDPESPVELPVVPTVDPPRDASPHLGTEPAELARELPGVDTADDGLVASSKGAASRPKLVLRDEIHRIVCSCGKPVTIVDVCEALDAKINVKPVTIRAYLALPPYFRFDAKRYGLLNRDLPGGTDARQQALDHVAARLRRRGYGLDEKELREALASLSATHASWTREMCLSVVHGDRRFRTSSGGGVGLAIWYEKPAVRT